MLKLRLRIGFVLLLLAFNSISSGLITPNLPIENQNAGAIPEFATPSAESPSLTWTSRTQNEWLPLGNDSSAIGDHVVVNATFPEEANVTRCEMRIWNGFTVNITQPLVIPTDPGGVFDGVIDPAQFDWVTIKGMEKGLQVNITCNFTTSDVDFMAWDGNLDLSDYTYANNIVDMASGDHPENDVIIWESESDTMIIGCLDYCGEVGNWTLHLQVGADNIAQSYNSTVAMDTYYFTAQNQTYTINVTGYTASNTKFTFIRDDVGISNFFAPNVTIYGVEPLVIDENSYNISWSSTDKNADDVNIYSVYLSNNDGVSFMLLAQNLTRTWLVWNSSGWLEDDYIFRVRAYSIDLAIPGMADLSDPPEGYWPGDYGDSFSISIRGGEIRWGHPPNDYAFEIDLATYSSYYLDSVGNTINVTVNAFNYLTWSIRYLVTDNGSLWIQDEYQSVSSVDSFEINVDGLSLGYHVLVVRVIHNYVSHYKTCYVNVTILEIEFTNPNSFDTSLLFQALAVGISTGSIAIIALVIVLSLRLKRNRTVEYVSAFSVLQDRHL